MVQSIGKSLELTMEINMKGAVLKASIAMNVEVEKRRSFMQRRD